MSRHRAGFARAVAIVALCAGCGSSAPTEPEEEEEIDWSLCAIGHATSDSIDFTDPATRDTLRWHCP